LAHSVEESTLKGTAMKTQRILIILLLLAALAGLGSRLIGPANAQVDTREVMKVKLQHSQRVLEGIVTEDFQLIGENARRLQQLSQAAGWRARNTPEYELFTTEFRRHAKALEKAAEQKNIDAATGSYMQMTVSCVSCHKYIRGKDVASLR
jgi:hypothetical protein